MKKRFWLVFWTLFLLNWIVCGNLCNSDRAMHSLQNEVTNNIQNGTIQWFNSAFNNYIGFAIDARQSLTFWEWAAFISILGSIYLLLFLYFKWKK